MLGALIPIVSGAISALGGLFGAHEQRKGAQEANAANAQQAELNRQFQERMSSTSYQRAVEDMRKAGLNPALAYQQGGASSPSGAQATMENTGAQAGATLANTAAQAASIAQQIANIRLTEAQSRQIRLESATRFEDLRAMLSMHQSNAIVAENTKDAEIKHKQADSLFAQQTLGIRSKLEQAKYDATISSARQMNADALLKELAAPEARNRANAQSTWFMKRVAPYLNSANDVKRLIQF